MPLIVIDPGHGGRDSGTTGNGYQESMLVLQTSLLLRDALRRCGFTVLMTREVDSLPLPSGTIAEDLDYRAKLANDANADLFVAWHVDSATSADVSGIATWIYPAARGTRTETWAQRIVNAIAAASGQNNRGVYYGDFAVLRETNMDAVLVEAGFITNETEANNLASPSFQQAQAEGATQAICQTFGMTYVPPNSNPAPTPTPTPAPTQEEWPAWATEAIRTMIQWDVMVGYPDGTWRPDETVTRAELASALLRFSNFMRNGGV